MGDWSCTTGPGKDLNTEVGMKGNRFIRTLLVIAAFWALFTMYTP
jgi:hypothetical protein